MSVEAMTWALRVPVGGNQKVVLLGLANHAHPDGSEAYPSLDTLAVYAHCDRSTARRNVRKLAETGWIVEDGIGPRGQTKWRLPLGLQNATPPDATRGTSAREGVAPTPPEPSLEPSTEREAPRADAREHPPADFPEALRPHAKAVYKILRQVAADHGAKRVWPLALGRVIMAHPRKPLVAQAHALARWSVDPGREVKDVVRTYETFLRREPELEAPERLAGDGTPTSAPANGHGPNVVPIDRPRNETAMERERRERRERKAEREQWFRDNGHGAMIDGVPETEVK